MAAFISGCSTWAARSGYLTEDSPSAVVLNYFNALQRSDFERAYDFISPEMKENRTRKQFTKDWNNIVRMAKLEIHDFGVSSVEVVDGKAAVTTWSRSSDVFNPQGIMEREIDRLVRIDNVWKLDETELLIE